MNPFKKKKNRDHLIIFSLSVLIHVILFLIFMLTEINYYPSKITYTTLRLINIAPGKTQKGIKNEKPGKAEKIHYVPQAGHFKNNIPNKKVETAAVADTVLNLKKLNKSNGASADTNLKYASTLLDTFLVRHPEYARYILQQQAKNLVENKNNKMFTRLEMETKINDELHKYIKQNFPEGSEHAMNNSAGPGMQIPIDGLIDAIKKIFK